MAETTLLALSTDSILIRGAREHNLKNLTIELPRHLVHLGGTQADQLSEAFTERYGRHPSHLVTAPGRVNLIGEHTDYSLLPVLPFAIDRTLLVAIGEGKPGAVRADSVNHPDALHLPDEGVRRGWQRYLQSVIDILGWSGQGADILVGGDLPSTGGLSSSSALSVGLIAALNAIWRLDLDMPAMIDRAVRSERMLGVEGGSMDQTVIALAEAGAALRIDFDPPATRMVPIPSELAIVAAYSGETSPKGTSTKHAYNEKVAACRAAAVLLGHLTGVDAGSPPTLSHLARVPNIERWLSNLPLHATAAEVGRTTGLDTSLITQFSVTTLDPDRPLRLQASVRHVLSETDRVGMVEQALIDRDFETLGALLDQSHESLQDFGASTPTLDRLVEAMRTAGAYGSRLTGAGFGGYALAVCAPDVVPRVVAAANQATGGPAFRVRPSPGLAMTSA